jgi:hypothetical protein
VQRTGEGAQNSRERLLDWPAHALLDTVQEGTTQVTWGESVAYAGVLRYPSEAGDLLTLT